MLREQTFPEISEFLRYLANDPEAERGLPPLKDLSEELGSAWLPCGNSLKWHEPSVSWRCARVWG